MNLIDSIKNNLNDFWIYLVENIETIFINIFSNIMSDLFAFLFSASIGYWLLKKIANKSIQVESQTYISGESSHIVCSQDNYSINEMPEILLTYRKKLKTENKNNVIFFKKTRVSTFILFTDGKRILLYDREV